MTLVDLDRLDPGAQYEVKVMALVQNREGTPVSVRVTTRESARPLSAGVHRNTHCRFQS